MPPADSLCKRSIQHIFAKLTEALRALKIVHHEIVGTAGLVVPENDYHIPPLDRMGRDEVFDLISRKRYFIRVDAPPTGKTSALLALMDELNEAGPLPDLLS